MPYLVEGSKSPSQGSESSSAKCKQNWIREKNLNPKSLLKENASNLQDNGFEFLKRKSEDFGKKANGS